MKQAEVKRFDSLYAHHCYRRPENQQFLTVKKPAKPNYEHSNALYAKACGTRLRTHHGSWSRKYHQPNWPTTGAG